MGLGRVVVLGLGGSGEAAARALLQQGATVTVLDAADGGVQRARAAHVRDATVILGRTDPADVAGADLVVASPGVPPSSPWLKAADAAGVAIWSEIELAYRLGVRPVAAITGTNGKTTTTQMLESILRAAGRPARAAGNIGLPLIETLDSRDEIVAEVSSFQLHWIDEFRAPCSILLNIAHDHLDWHGTFEAYAADKARLFAAQGADDVAVVLDDPTCRRIVGTRARVVPFHPDRAPDGGAGVDRGWIVVPEGRVVALDRLRIATRPARADAVAAAAGAAAVGVPLDAIANGLRRFEPHPHRLEPVATVAGVAYVNDSKASDPHATLAALEEMADVVLIAGGRNKGLDLGELAAAADRLRGVVAIGEAASEVAIAFAGTEVPVELATTMDEAVHAAAARARPGSTVLLSPACASWDMFTDYRERGDAFKAAIARLEGRSA